MDSDLPALDVEIGRIVVRSWEHEWKTEEKTSSSVASAQRLLPSDFTKPVYDILERGEQYLLRSSLPFLPYDLRIRRANNEWMGFAGQVDWLLEWARLRLHLGELCPGWDNALPQPSAKKGKYGQMLYAPGGDSPIIAGYEVVWQPILPFEGVDLDKLLREFSPRYKAPSIFESIAPAQNYKGPAMM